MTFDPSDAALTKSVEALVALALEEDIGNGDWTTRWTVAPEARAEGAIRAKESMVVAGAWVAARVFRAVDPELQVEPFVDEGTEVEDGASVLLVRGHASGILTAERTALNFIGRLSGIATLTRRFVEAVAGHTALIVDTRKTTPGWRRLEKWAVRVGGGSNHRMGLYDMVLIKDNHVLAAGGIREAVQRVRERNELGLPVQVEVRGIDEMEELRGSGVDRVLLDNMDLASVREIVSRVATWPTPRPQLEASGGVTLEGVRELAATGVDRISVGALTHSAAAADLSMGLTEVSTGADPEKGDPGDQS